jgi:hypothetical protein
MAKISDHVGSIGPVMVPGRNPELMLKNQEFVDIFVFQLQSFDASLRKK